MTPVSRAAPVLRHRSAAVLLAIALGVTCWFAMAPSLAPPGHHSVDTYLHVLCFAMLAVLAWLGFRGRSLALVLLLLAAFGGSIEIGQMLVPGRTGSLSDWLGDVAGIVIGFLASHSLLAGLAQRWPTALRGRLTR
ncbi:MAG TPA: VanZ family protein [Azospirillaceae bacterium]|nr:VanZ family protein [Azospirillaceae bacterium]